MKHLTRFFLYEYKFAAKSKQQPEPDAYLENYRFSSSKIKFAADSEQKATSNVKSKYLKGCNMILNSSVFWKARNTSRKG